MGGGEEGEGGDKSGGGGLPARGEKGSGRELARYGRHDRFICPCRIDEVSSRGVETRLTVCGPAGKEGGGGGGGGGVSVQLSV